MVAALPLMLSLTLAAPADSGRVLPSFGSLREFRQFLKSVQRPAMRHLAEAAFGAVDAMAAPSAASGMGGEARQSITNTQVAGVDEGGIVKLHGDHLVMLRRGRLFTVAVGDAQLRPVDAVDAFGPNVDPSGTWYDEMLVAGDKVVVIGYSYERGGTEVGLFHISDRGRLRYLATYQLRSNDYYSARNYASRLIGDKLIFYAPLELGWGGDPLASLPGVRRWRGNTDDPFRHIAAADRIYRPAGWRPQGDVALHSVTVCDLSAPEMDCKATVVVGPSGRVFYVSQGSVYVWMSEWRTVRDSSVERSMVVRMPLDGSAPSALKVKGSPVDQFGFLEDDDGYLNALVTRDGGGDWMWASTAAQGADAALLRVPLAAFGDGTGAAPRSAYRALPAPAAGDELHERFVGRYLLYGAGAGWGGPASDSGRLVAVPWRGGPITQVVIPSGVDRIEQMGPDAVVVGTLGSDLHFSGISLAGRPRVVQRYVLADAAQGELRSHGFFYRMDGRDSGVLGLPVTGGGRAGWRHLVEGSASVLFVQNDDGEFRELGLLEAGNTRMDDDACRASCVDWYGNARPLFVGRRVFALMGYELVEGRIADGAISEVRRVNYSPVAMTASRRPNVK